MACPSRKQCCAIALALVLVEIVIILVSEIKLHFLRSVGDGPVEQLNGYNEDETVESFVRLYHSYCHQHFYPHKSNVPVKFMPDYNRSLCSCVPRTLGKLSQTVCIF